MEQSFDQKVKQRKEPVHLSKTNRPTPSARRILGDSKSHHNSGPGHFHTNYNTESVNTDPATSPKKDRLQKPPPVENNQETKIISRNRLSTRKSQFRKETDMPSQPQSPKMVQLCNDIHTASLNPKTPDPTTMTSPSISTASTSQQKSRDTPPPTDLRPETNPGPDSSTDQARPSRRARAAVNYAEPNLNRKMRRPTGTMVDAIGREERRQSCAEAVVPVKVEPTDEDVNIINNVPQAVSVMTELDDDPANIKAPEIKKRTVFIKTEGNPRSDWKTLPVASPTQHSLGSHGSLERKANDTRSGEDDPGGPENGSQSAASSVISTLAASGKQPSRKPNTLIRNTTESAIVVDQSKNHDRYSRRSSSNSNVSDVSNRSIYDMQSSPSAKTPDSMESVNNDGSEYSNTANNAGSLRAKKLSGMKTQRVSVGPGNITSANSLRRERTKDVNAARVSAKGLVSDRHGGGEDAEDRNTSLKEGQTRNNENTSDLKPKSRTVPKRRSMLL